MIPKEPNLIETFFGAPILPPEVPRHRATVAAADVEAFSSLPTDEASAWLLRRLGVHGAGLNLLHRGESGSPTDNTYDAKFTGSVRFAHESRPRTMIVDAESQRRPTRLGRLLERAGVLQSSGNVVFASTMDPPAPEYTVTRVTPPRAQLLDPQGQ